MDQIQEHIRKIYSTSFMSQRFFVDKQRNELVRFVFIGVQKIYKVSLAFIKLYPNISNNEDLEFSLGILARSLLMDMILMMEIKSIILKI